MPSKDYRIWLSDKAYIVVSAAAGMWMQAAGLKIRSG